MFWNDHSFHQCRSFPAMRCTRWKIIFIVIALVRRKFRSNSFSPRTATLWKILSKVYTSYWYNLKSYKGQLLVFLYTIIICINYVFLVCICNSIINVLHWVDLGPFAGRTILKKIEFLFFINRHLLLNSPDGWIFIQA